MPIVGQFGSLAGLGSLVLPGGAMESIATVTVGSGGASSITFSDIPGGFQHLQVRYVCFGSSAADIGTQFNGVTTGGLYTRHSLEGNGSAASASGAANVDNIFTASFGTSTSPGAGIIDVLDYSSTSKFKTLRSFIGYDANGSGVVRVQSGLYRSTSAVTSMLMFGTANFSQHSTFALFGLRAP